MTATLTRKNRSSRAGATERPPVAGAYVLASDLGYMAICWQGDVLTGLSFGHPSASAAAARLSSPVLQDEAIPPVVRQAIDRLQRLAAGEPDDLRDVPISLERLTKFQRSVVSACRRIGAGKVKSYGELAATAGYPGAARAVGNVMRSNRYPLIVPCHRVVGADGKLCGFTCPEGLLMKERLLVREGSWSRKPR